MPTTEKLPILALLALTVSGFIAIITETLPAGLLPQISHGIGVSEAYAGQLITSYALGSVLAAIPVISLTRNWNRKPLLLIAVSGFFIFNLCTFLLHNYAALLAIRLLAGISAGIIWGLLTGYTMYMVSAKMAGKALAIVGVGQPIALSLGVPLATWLGASIGWASIFLIIAVLSFLVLFWIILLVPDFQVEQKTVKTPFKKVLSSKKIQKILFITLLWILAHNLLYTYIAPFLTANHLVQRIDLILLLFGVFSIIGIWLTGLWIDKYLHKLLIINLVLFVFAGALLYFGNTNPVFIFLGVVLWGYSFGGAPILLQKDLADVAKGNVDIAQAIFVTIFNIAVAGGGLLGGGLLKFLGANYIVIAFFLLALGALVALIKKKNKSHKH